MTSQANHSAGPGGPTPADDASHRADTEGSTVLEVFGVEIRVRNPRLAEVLTRDLVEVHSPSHDAQRAVEGAGNVHEPLPDTMVNPSTPRTDEEARNRSDLRSRVEIAGRGLGFEVRPSGVWVSPSKAVIVTRMLDRAATLAAASDFIAKLDDALAKGGAQGAAVLVIVGSPSIAGEFVAAVRQRRAHDHVRVISVDDLEFLLLKHAQGAVDHQGVIAVLTAVADIDVGVLLNVVRSAGVNAGADE